MYTLSTLCYQLVKLLTSFVTTDLSIVISNYMTRPCGTGSRHVQGKNKAIAKLLAYPKNPQGLRSITIWSCK